MGNAWQSLPERERGVGDGGTVDGACEEVTCDEIGIPRTQINEMKSAEMPKSYRRVPANGTPCPLTRDQEPLLNHTEPLLDLHRSTLGSILTYF